MDPTQPFQGDWDDLAASASAAARAVSASIEKSRIDDARATFHMRDFSGRPITLEVTRQGDDLMLAAARVGRFGDQETEQRLLDAFAHRLDQLHGVDFAPR